MKATLIILLTLLLSNNLFASELNWINEQIEAIKPPRKGVIVAAIEDPFVFLEKNMSKEKDTKKTTIKSAALKSNNTTEEPKQEITTVANFDLTAIINSSAMINGNWYKVNDTIKGYNISEINRDNVILKKDKNLILLSTTTTNKQTLKFKNR